MRSRLLGAGALAALGLLGGCRTAPPPTFPTAAPWEVHRPQLQALSAFELRGRVAVATGKDGFNANLHWTQQGPHSALTLEGPLGVGAVQVSAADDTLEIVTANGTHLGNDAAHAELAQRLGFDPPLASLRYWILGVPDPRQPSTEEVDQARQRLSGLTQEGWRIDYTLYVAVGPDWVPSRLTLQRDAVRLRLVVDDWQL